MVCTKHSYITIGLGCGLANAATFYPIIGITSDTSGTDFFPAARLIEGPGVGFDADDNANGAISANLRFSDTTTFIGAPFEISGITQAVDPRQSFSFPDVTARYVELVPTDNLFGIAPPGGDRVGLGEVAFAVPTVIPEPSSALLALLGLAGLARRRR